MCPIFFIYLLLLYPNCYIRTIFIEHVQWQTTAEFLFLKMGWRIIKKYRNRRPLHNSSWDPYLTNLSDFYTIPEFLCLHVLKMITRLITKNSFNSLGIFLIRFIAPIPLLYPFSPFRTKQCHSLPKVSPPYSSGNKGCLKNNSWHPSSRQIFYGCFKLKTPMSIYFPPTNCQMEIIILESGAIWRP